MTIRPLFVSTSIILLAAGLYYRAHNAAEAHQQVTTIQTLDTAGGDTTTAITTLKAFVAGHMGASITFTLTAAAQRAQAAATAAAAAAAANTKVYAAAQVACSGHTDSITQAECNQRYLSQHLVSEPATPIPAASTYQYALHAPLWSPDLAGALLLGAVLAAGAALWYRPSKRRFA